MGTFFRDAYPRTFIGTKATTANTNQVQGFLVTAGLGTDVLNINTGTASTTYGVGSYGFFDAKTFKSVTTASISSSAPNLVLAAASLRLKDQLNPFYGGLKETNKSKEINARLVSSWQKYVPCTARNKTVHFGKTNYTHAASPYDTACNFEFACGEAYTMRLEVRNDPVRRYLNRDAYALYTFKAPCCADNAPGQPIDSTLAFIDWAQQITDDVELNPFVSIIVYSEAGLPLYPPGTASVNTWDNYVSPGHTIGASAGMRIQGAYVETVFGNCSFEPTDYYNIVPVDILVGMIDFTGDQCAFTGICVKTECEGREGTGFGETILREEILTELYRQQPYVNDPRVREIIGGDDVLAAISRTTQYYRYSLTHNVPRLDNNTNSYSNDQFSLNIISTAANSTLETFISTWLSNAGSGVSLETFSCGACTPMTP